MKKENTSSYVSKPIKITKPCSLSKGLSIFTIFSYSIAIGLFAYLISSTEGEIGVEGDKTYTISQALAHGNKPGLIVFLTFGTFSFLNLINSRGPREFLKLRLLLIFISYLLVISLLWVTTDENKNAHYSLTGIIFLSLLTQIVLSYYVFYKNYLKDGLLFIFLIFLNIIATTALVVFACFSGELETDIFAGFELLFGLLVSINILFLGFY